MMCGVQECLVRVKKFLEEEKKEVRFVNLSPGDVREGEGGREGGREREGGRGREGEGGREREGARERERERGRERVREGAREGGRRGGGEASEGGRGVGECGE